MKRLLPACFGLLLLSAPSSVPHLACGQEPSRHASGPLAPNGDFLQVSDGSPLAWQLSGGQGRWLAAADGARGVLELTGDEGGSNQWLSDPIAVTPGGLYRFTARARCTTGSGGCVPMGAAGISRDYHLLDAQWREVTHVFRVSDDRETIRLRLAQWESPKTYQFDWMKLEKVIPVERLLPVETSKDPVRYVELGQDESVAGGVYSFDGRYSREGANYHRVLHRATAGFNSDRFTFGSGQEVVYRFELPTCRLGEEGYENDGPIPLRSATVSCNVNYHTRGACRLEASADGESWTLLASRRSVGSLEATIPATMFPAAAIYLRLSATEGASLQVNRVSLAASMESRGTAPLDNTKYLSGDTCFATINAIAPRMSGVKLRIVGRLGAEEMLIASLPGRDLPTYHATQLHVQSPDGDRSASADHAPIPCPPCIAWTGFGHTSARRDVTAAADGSSGTILDVQFTVQLPLFYRGGYGYALGSPDDSDAFLWWAEPGWKIPQTIGALVDRAKPIQLRAAQNDHEAFQLVVRAPDQQSTTLLSATSTDLTGPDGAVLPASEVSINRVYYHFVHTPTDKTGVRDYWPDALPPLDGPLEVAPGTNQPLWITVHVGEDVPPGDYEGRLRLTFDVGETTVPYRLHVWDFMLPRRNHLATAFGLSAGDIFRYHNLASSEDRRRVLEMYFENFARHRVSPYDPAPLDPIRVTWRPDADPPRAGVDFSAFDRAMEHAIEKYNFTHFRLRVRGMGGGTFHARVAPKIGRHGEETPEYEAMFADYAKKLESHLREKGWLDMAYVYWFDEPAPKDYAFVARGMQRLRKYAPGLVRMITEEPGEAFLECDPAIDIWCPVSFQYDHVEAEKRRSQGEAFWWYVCTGPKAPYCTLFIDHPATELRVWHWQAWQRGVVGSLVWKTNYWTSSAAFPDSYQNPYEDPMGYRSGYSTPPGVKAYWGNGDGRFLYPPLSAAVPGGNHGKPILEPPVSSIRWEMIREGIEDYEMLWMLRALIAKHGDDLPDALCAEARSLLVVPEAITSDMTTFTTDPRPIRARRAKIGAMIERIGRLP